MKVNYRKVLRELKTYKGRTIMAFLGILMGIASIGAVLASYSILTREMDVNYMNTNPSSIVFKVSNLDPQGMKLIKESNENIDVEARKTLLARIDRGNGTYGTIYLFSVEDFNNLKVDTFTLEKGEFPNNFTQMALERDSLKNLLNLNKGYDESVTVKLPGGKETNINLSGVVHAPGLSPASMEKYSYAFLQLEGLQALGYQGWYDEVHLVCYNNRFNREELRVLAADIKDRLMTKGYKVERVDVPVPGKHPHGDQLKSLLFLLQAFTVISLFVACIIIINLLNFILSTQTKQIAIMKSAGASIRDIAMPYFLYVLLISVGAIIVSIPIAIVSGSVYSFFAAGILNFKITSYHIPFWAYALQVLSGIFIPLVASFYPIYKSCKISVIDGLTEQTGSNPKSNGQNILNQSVIIKASFQIIMPLKNVFRKKGRTILAVLALSAGGVLFMTSQNIVASIGRTVDVSMNTFGYNYDIRLYGQYSDEKIMKALKNIKWIDEAEICKSNTASFQKKDRTNSSFYAIKALPRDSKMINFKLVEGSGLNTLDNAVIINKAVWDEEKWIEPGMTVAMAIGGKSTQVTIAGIVNEVPPLPCIYMNLDNYEAAFGGSFKQNILLSTQKLNAEDQLTVTKEIEKSLKAEGIEISETWNIGLLRTAFVEHLKVIVDLLSVVALLAIVVGGLSIASAIGLNITERRREMGVLRAIGANRRQTISMISLEVILMGLAGWLTGLILAYPVSIWAGNYFGQIFLHSDLNNALSVSGAIMWLVISMILSFISGLVPASQAASSPLTEMLAYE